MDGARSSEVTRFVPLGAQQEDENAQESEPVSAKVIRLLNEAQLVGKDKKLDCLHKVKELVVRSKPDLLDSFLDEVIAFQQDPVADVRKFVVGFMEEACKIDSGLLSRVIPMLGYMMRDENIGVLKRVVVCFIQLYRLALLYIAKSKSFSADMQDMWEALKEGKQQVLDMCDSANDGIRTLVIKFMEVLILAHTKKEPTSELPKGTDADLSLDAIPPTQLLLDPSELREEAGTAMGALLQLTASPTASSVNLMASIGSLSSIARQRPSYIPTVVQAFELLHANLPPHFAMSQVSSVRKQLKTQVLALLRHPASYDCCSQITTLLTDLGCTQAEIARNTPKVSPEGLKRSRPSGETEDSPLSKKSKTMSVLERRGEAGESEVDSLAPGSAFIDAVEMTSSDLRPLLMPEAVTELVMRSMSALPSHMPGTFKSSYTPIAAAGTDAQVAHLARLLASQMTAVGIGVGASAKGISTQKQQKASAPIVSDPRRRRGGREPPTGSQRGEEEEGEGLGREERWEGREEPPSDQPDLAESMAELSRLGSLLGLPSILDPMFPVAYTAFFGSLPPTTPAEGTEGQPTSSIDTSNLVTIETKEEPRDQAAAKEKKKLQHAGPQRLKKIRVFELLGVVQRQDRQWMHGMSLTTFKRVLAAEKNALCGGAGNERVKLIITLVTQFREDFQEALQSFILEDLKANLDLAIAWLFAEYSLAEGLHGTWEENLRTYDQCLTGLLRGAKETLGPKDRLFTRLVLEAPRVTQPALDIVVSYCSDDERAFLGVSTLKDLVVKRPWANAEVFHALMQATMSEVETARAQALLYVKRHLYVKPDLAPKIERFALQSLENLMSDHPTFLHSDLTDMEVASEWSEDTVCMCLNLFLSILTLNHKLLKDLAMVYTRTVAAVKRVILKHMDQPVRCIGMESPELLSLVEAFPPGSETLIIRMLHILTESSPPSVGLVNRVRGIYQRNTSDVRFLIPVLHGLQKQEVIDALPKLISLSPNLVKGVFDRLLVSYRADQGHRASPVAPSELLLALVSLDCKGEEALMKSVIKAINLCFAEKGVYTQEVLAIVLQQASDLAPIPTLLLRTILQSLQACPRLLGFIMNILHKLISKQIWKQPKAWQGFVKCCELTKPESFPVLLQLPARQLESILEQSPGLKESLYSHLLGLPPYQVHRSLLRLFEHEEGRKPRKSKGKERRHTTSSEDRDTK